MNRVFVFELCRASDCRLPIYAKGYCHTHLVRVNKWDDPNFLEKRGPKMAKAEASPHWVENPAYPTVHSRLRKGQGRASNYLCLCGAQARDWAFDHNTTSEVLTDPCGRKYTADIWEYVPLCRSHHMRLDRGRMTLEQIAALKAVVA